MWRCSSWGVERVGSRVSDAFGVCVCACVGRGGGMGGCATRKGCASGEHVRLHLHL
jgi:hypothetical protein